MAVVYYTNFLCFLTIWIWILECLVLESNIFILCWFLLLYWFGVNCKAIKSNFIAYSFRFLYFSPRLSFFFWNATNFGIFSLNAIMTVFFSPPFFDIDTLRIVNIFDFFPYVLRRGVSFPFYFCCSINPFFALLVRGNEPLFPVCNRNLVSSWDQFHKAIK